MEITHHEMHWAADTDLSKPTAYPTQREATLILSEPSQINLRYNCAPQTCSSWHRIEQRFHLGIMGEAFKSGPTKGRSILVGSHTFNSQPYRADSSQASRIHTVRLLSSIL